MTALAGSRALVVFAISVGASDRAQRAIAFIALVVLGVALWWFAGMPSRQPRGIGPLEGGDADAPDAFRAAGGVGRFTRVRHHPPGGPSSS